MGKCIESAGQVALLETIISNSGSVIRGPKHCDQQMLKNGERLQGRAFQAQFSLEDLLQPAGEKR